MRIRSIKPEFYRSEDVKQLPREIRLLFIGLWSYVDDNGVGVDDHRLIASDLFPLEDDQTEVRNYVRDGLAMLSRVLLVARYEVDGKRYLFVNSWDKHQRIDRPSKARYPRPSPAMTSDNAESGAEFDEPSMEARDTLDAGTGEQGNRGTKRTSRTSRSGRYTDEFEQWWQLYPKRDGSKGSKFAASRAWSKALKADPAETLTAAVRVYANTRRVKDGFAKDATTWLNQRCWEEFAGDNTETDPNEWLRGEYRAGRVHDIEERTGLRYTQPDLPGDLADKTAIADWLRNQAREWIAGNRDAILSRLTERRSA